MKRLYQLLDHAAETAPDRGLGVYRGASFRWPELREAARRAAGAARSGGLRPGDPVLLLVAEPLDFFVLFWGVIWAGATPVPLAAPRDASPEERRRVERVARLLGGPVVVDRGLSVPGTVAADAWMDGDPVDPVDSDAPALVQFSSGSTRAPRGVVLTHANLLANVHQLATTLPFGPDDVNLVWMPHSHDMGLIGAHLAPLVSGMAQLRMDPRDAMRDPLVWLREAERCGATHLSTTNTALTRTNRRLQATGERPDLSRVRFLFNGAEPISADACRTFSRLTGVPETAHWPLYGLAEASVGVLSPRAGGLRTREIDGREVVVVGEPLPDVEIRVVDGELWVRGPNVFAGYWRDAEATAEVLADGWLRTGDLVDAGDGVAIVGRAKDVICLDGRNLHAHDVEAVAEGVDGVRAAVALPDGRGASEALVVGVTLRDGADAAAVADEVRRRVAAEAGVDVARVLILPAIPRTTSGKKQRAALRKALAAGELDDRAIRAGGTPASTGGSVSAGGPVSARVSPAVVLETLRGLAAEVLRRPIRDEDLDRPIRELGASSIAIVDLLGRAEARLGKALDHRLLRDEASLRTLAARIEEGQGAGDEVARRGREGEPVAVVAAACRFPGADTPEALWDAIRAGRSFVGPRPASRADTAPDRPGAFLDDVAGFDAARFRIPDDEAAAMDPQQRLVLTVAAEAIERAGVRTRQCAVFVGAGQLAYQETVLRYLDDGLPPGALAGNLLNLLAARVSHHLDLVGPAMAVDTACSASLVAVQLACRSLWAGECEVALAGGVNLDLTDTVWRLFDAAGALSPTGRCRPFAADRDGMVPGEGAAIVVLAPLARARAEGWPILGVLRGVAVNNDGASLGVMAPNPAAQERVMRAALDAAGVAPDAVGFVEAHATGTPVGDEVESGVIARVYPHGPRIGAVKGQIGHLLGGAGIAGLIRLIGELGPGEVGAVSSFGFGGTNAHAIVEGPPEGAPRPAPLADRAPPPRHWLGALDATGWVHVARSDPGGGLRWSPCPTGGPAGGRGFRRGGTYVIAGGAGALGRVVARHLARRYGARIALVGRRAEPVGLVADLRRLGGEARYFAADLAEEAALGPIRAWTGPVDGVLHLAGTVRGEGADDPLRSKVDVLATLERLQAPLVVLFTSIAGVLPGLDAGIEQYAEANRRLDRYAARAGGARVVAIAWPPWAGAGMAAGHEDAFVARGIRPIEPLRALAALEWAVGSGQSNVVVLDRRGAADAIAAPLAGEVRDRVRQTIAAALGVPTERLAESARLVDLGLDSLVAMDLVKDLEGVVGRGLPTTLLFEHPTLGGLLAALDAGAVREEAAPAPADPAAPVLPSQQTFLVQRSFFPDVPGNVLLGVTVAPGVERAALEAALDAVVARHPALRLAFRREGSWVAVEGAPPALHWGPFDEDAVLNTTFDLERGPVLHAWCDGRRLWLDAHHAAVDAWSLRNVLLDLLDAHEAHRAGGSAALAPLRATWAEAAALLARGTGADDGFWRSRFADGVPPLHLPWDAPVDAPGAGPAGAHHEVFAADVTAALEQRARALGVSLPALVLATYVQALWRWSGQHDVVVRVAQGRRELRLPDVERVVGSFADSLPVRVRFDPGAGFAALARRVHDELVAVQAHADASAMGLAELAPRSAAGPVGLTPAGFSFPHLPAPETVGALTLSDVRGASASGFTRIGLIAWVFGGRLHASWNHLHSHLSHAKVRRLAAGHRAIAEAVARGEEATRPDRLHVRIVERCRRHPERVAIEGVTYGELDRRSAALARRLAGRGPRVAVLAWPGADAVVSVLGVMRAGAAYVPLDPDWPTARVAQVLAEAQLSAVIADRVAAEAHRDALMGHEVLAPPADGEPAAEGPADARGDVAYVMFTSGSTGRPKGVVVRHEAVLAFLDWVEAAFGVTEADRFVQTSSLAFGGSIRQMFSPLLAGATIHPVRKELVRDPDALVRFLRDERITVWNSVPALIEHLHAALERTGLDRPLPDVRWVLLGGEAVPADLVRRWWARWGGQHRLVNLYGSTETIVNATFHEVVRAPEPDEVHVPIGWPRAGVQVELLDVVDGVGEIAVGGLVADGWLGQPDAAEFFARDGVRWYRTGDLARRGPDGALVYLGRRDGQVQVYGNRVELAEIEHLLCNHPDVAAAAVVQVDGRLEATVEGRADPAALRAYVAERLPAYMVPHRIAVAARLPRTPAGKVDRLALRSAPGAVEAAPEAASAPVAAASAPVGSSLQEALAAIWRAVLDLRSDPSPDDDFFALGGDSMLALAVLEGLRERGLAVPRPILLYRHRTLRSLAEAVAAADPARPVPITPSPSPRAAEGEPAPLSAVQRGFWLAHRANPDAAPAWTARVPVRGPVDPEAFRRALGWLVARHPMLRTTFRDGPFGPVQVAGPPPAALPLATDDLAPLPPAVREIAREGRWAEALAGRWDLAEPAWRARLVHLGPHEHELVLAAHHLIADAWSAWVLAGELFAAHDAYAAGRVPDLPPPAPFDRVAQAPLPAADPWWRSALADLAQGPAPARARACDAELALDAASWDRLRDRARRAAVTPYLLVLHAFVAALAEVLATDDVVVATALDGRDAHGREVAGTVGPFAMALPVRVRGSMSAEVVASAFGEACAHADAAPLEIVSAAGADGLARLGRFFLSWLDPSGVAVPASAARIDWARGRYRFATAATGTEVMLGALVDDGLHVHLHGCELVERVAPVVERHLRRLAASVDAALVVYAPDELAAQVAHLEPVAIERVEAADGSSELVLLPRAAGALDAPGLEEAVRAAIAATDAPVIALAGMLPSLTGLGARPLADRVVTTGHAATVVAMVRTIALALERTGRRWADLRVGVLGYGSIGRSTLELAVHVLGEPASVAIRDPRLGRTDPLDDADLILAATSGGRAIDPDALRAGTVVIDDSFPRAFDDAAARARMTANRDVLLVGGGMLDVGPLRRTSPFPGAEALRERYGAQWLPGCHAEALLVAAEPALGPTVGPVDLARARAVWDAIERRGWRAAPLHLGGWVVPDDVAGLAGAR